MIQGTSRKAYKEGRDSFKKQMEQVFYFFKNHPGTSDQECATTLFMQPSTVSARRNDLLKQKRIEPVSIKKCEFTGRSVMTWAVSHTYPASFSPSGAGVGKRLPYLEELV